MTTHRVVMRTTTRHPDGTSLDVEAVDPEVPDDMLEQYLADARSLWAEVTHTPNGDTP